MLNATEASQKQHFAMKNIDHFKLFLISSQPKTSHAEKMRQGQLLSCTIRFQKSSSFHSINLNGSKTRTAKRSQKIGTAKVNIRFTVLTLKIATNTT